LIAKIHPLIQKPLQVGIVIDHGVDTFLIKWISFNKEFFMEKEGDIFKELNKTFLLHTVQVHRNNMEENLSLLNSSYNNDKEGPD
tara:strand:+ start:96 stop:350 length:255 start_codon:yes stop_codon:yes gene_type:complete